jgi:hypothetical protein
LRETLVLFLVLLREPWWRRAIAEVEGCWAQHGSREGATCEEA